MAMRFSENVLALASIGLSNSRTRFKCKFVWHEIELDSTLALFFWAHQKCPFSLTHRYVISTAIICPFSRNFTQSRILSSDDDLPYHIVVGMPALSPTMETGILSEWYLEEGAEFSAGKE